MLDAVAPIDEVFARARPTALVAERDCSMLTEHADQVKVAMSEYSSLNVQCATRFEDQLIPLYLPRIYPWSLNFECGGQEYLSMLSTKSLRRLYDYMGSVAPAYDVALLLQC